MIHVLLTDMACVIRFKLTYKQTIKDIIQLYQIEQEIKTSQSI